MTTVKRRDRAQEAAVRDYSEDWRSILEEAQEAADTGRPLKAAKLRAIAAKVHRAAVSEGTDEQPTGLER